MFIIDAYFTFANNLMINLVRVRFSNNNLGVLYLASSNVTVPEAVIAKRILTLFFFFIRICNDLNFFIDFLIDLIHMICKNKNVKF